MYSILRPLIWPFAAIHSLPSDLHTILESPMPFILGKQMSESNFQSKILTKMQANQRNRILIIYLDSSGALTYEFNPKDLVVPHFNGAFGHFVKEFGKLHGLKESRYLQIEKSKVQGRKEEVIGFRLRSKVEKKAVKNKSRPKLITQSQQLAYISFFKDLIQSNIISKIGQELAEQRGKNERMHREEITRILTQGADKLDVPFIDNLIRTQIFSYFTENNYLSL
jgi:hypothetical protein